MILFCQERAIPQININQRGHDFQPAGTQFSTGGDTVFNWRGYGFQPTGTWRDSDLSALKIEWQSLQIGIAPTLPHNHRPSTFYIIVYAIIKIIPSFSDYKTYLCNTPKQSAGIKASSITSE